VPLFLLANWKWLLPTAAAAVMGTMLMLTKLELSAFKLAVAEQKIEAANILAAETTKAAAADARNAELANKLDIAHAQAIRDAADSRDDFARRLLIARRGARCSGPAATETPHPGIGSDTPPGSDGGSGSADLALHLRDAALELQRYAIACHSWATQVGR